MVYSGRPTRRTFFLGWILALVLGLAPASSVFADDSEAPPPLPACPSGQNSINTQIGFDGLRSLDRHRKSCAKEWTVILYLAMDNDLSEFGEKNLADLFWAKAEDPEHHVDLVVQGDFRNRPGKRYVLEYDRDTGRPTDAVMEEFRSEDLNSGDPKILEDFLSWAVAEFPSRKYILVMGGHGDGWAASVPRTPEQMAQSNQGGRGGNGIAYDQTHEDWLSVPDLRRVLARVKNRQLDGRPFDIYAADACFMQQAEVVWDLRNEARFLYGSIPVMAYQGLPYGELLKRLSSKNYDSSDGPARLASELPKMMVDSYSGQNERVFASSVDTEKLGDTLVAALSRLGDIGVRWIQSQPSKAMMKQLLVQGAISDSIFHQNSVAELRDFLLQFRVALLRPEPRRSQSVEATQVDADEFALQRDLLESIDQVEEALTKSVVAWAAGSYFDRWPDRLGGLSIWLPSSAAYFAAFERQTLLANLHRHFCEDCPRVEGRSREEESERGNRWHEFLSTSFRPLTTLPRTPPAPPQPPSPALP